MKMGKTPWSPGPWHLVSGMADWGMPKQHEIYAVENPTDEGDCIAIVPSIQPYCMGAKEKDKQYARTQAANARLIAEAPEMAELLEEIADKAVCLAPAECLCCRARALLKRVKGGE